MLLRKLSVRDFLIFKKVDLDLADVRLASIIGRFAVDNRKSNGAGKTAILEAIRFALYDQTRSKQKIGVIRSGATECLVALEFDITGKRLKVIRKRTASGVAEARLYVDGRLAAEKTRDVNAMLISYVGIDNDLFDLIYYFKQRDQFGFTQSSPSERKTALAKAFNMSGFEKCLDISKARLKDSEAAVQRADGRLQALLTELNTTPTVEVLTDELDVAIDTIGQYQARYEWCELWSKDVAGTCAYFDEMYAEYERDIVESIQESVRCQEEAQTCSQKIADIQITLQQEDSQLQALKTRKKQLADRLKEFSHTAEQVEKATSNKAKFVADVEQLKNEAHHLKMTIAKLKKPSAIDGMSSDVCSLCGQVVSAAHVHDVRKKKEQDIADAEKLLKAIEFKLKAITSAIGRCDELLNANNEKLTVTRDLIQSEDHLNSMLKYTKKQTKEIERLICERDEWLLRYTQYRNDDLEDAASWKQRLIIYRNALAKMAGVVDQHKRVYHSRIVDASAAEKALREQIARRYELSEKVKQAEEAFNTAKVDVAVYSHLVFAFGKNGMQALMIDNAIGNVEVFANDILAKMNTRFTIVFKTQRETKQGDQKETLDILVYDNGVEKPFENYSGGEQTIINIAVRLALSRVISTMYNVEVRSIFLDEVLAELDEANREEAVKVISYLSRSFDQVFIISHTDEIKDIIDNTIAVTRHQEYSDVVITSNVA